MQTTYQVYAAHDGRNHSHNVEGQSYEDAALAFVEEATRTRDVSDETFAALRRHFDETEIAARERR